MLWVTRRTHGTADKQAFGYARGQGATHVIDLATGKGLAKVDLGGQVGAASAILGDRLYVGTMSTNELLAIDWKKAEIAWKLGKRYVQDEPLRWGVAVEEPSADLEKLKAPGTTLPTRRRKRI